MHDDRRFYYEGNTTILNYLISWDDMAGSVTESTDIEAYFTTKLGYTLNEYIAIGSDILNQHSHPQSNKKSDFAHMQYAIAARLAYKLNKTEHLATATAIIIREDLSYLGGWLGDAALTSSGGVTLKNDDCTADLDAENIFRKINNGMTSVQAINNYYEELSPTRTRATIFLEHIPYSTVQSKVLNYLGINQTSPWPILRNNYHDTYNFLLSLQDELENIGNYA